MLTKVWLGSLKGTDHSVDIGIDGRLILKWILRELDGRVWTGFIWLRMGLVMCSCEHSNEPSVTVKGMVYFYYLSDYQLHKKDSAPWCLIFIVYF
jgi:hypothetical protein